MVVLIVATVLILTTSFLCFCRNQKCSNHFGDVFQHDQPEDFLKSQVNGEIVKVLRRKQNHLLLISVAEK
jgi:hypothetical protein